MALKEFGTKAHLSDVLVLPNDKSKGIQVGDFADGENAGWCWRDITSDIVTRGLGATDPAWTQVGSTAFRFTRWQENDVCWFQYHIPHDIYIPPSGNATIYFHAHWFVDDSASPASGDVTWQWTYAYAKGFDQEAFDFTLSNSPLTTANIITKTQATGIPFQHMVAETAAVTIPGLTEPDGIICTQIKRIANPQSPLNNLSSDPFMITADIHYQSTNIGTKQKAPNFYAD